LPWWRRASERNNKKSESAGAENEKKRETARRKKEATAIFRIKGLKFQRCVVVRSSILVVRTSSNAKKLECVVWWVVVGVGVVVGGRRGDRETHERKSGFLEIK
jgi:hypothetical protein